MSMRLTVLGSGSPEAYARRASSGYLLEIGADRILFDCGGGVFDNLLRSGRMPTDITHIVFSHLHSDHMMDYARLIHSAWDSGGAPVRVYGPAPIRQITDAYFGRDGVMSHDLRARTELQPSQDVWVARGGTLPRPWPAPAVSEIVAGDEITGDGWRIQVCDVPHAQPVLMCLGFRVDHDGASFVYSGDSGPSPELEQLCQGADLLLHWCYRLDGDAAQPMMAAMTPTPSETAALAARCGVGRLILTHFRVRMDAGDGPARALAAMQAQFDGQVGIAEDLDVYEI